VCIDIALLRLNICYVLFTYWPLRKEYTYLKCVDSIACMSDVSLLQILV